MKKKYEKIKDRDLYHCWVELPKVTMPDGTQKRQRKELFGKTIEELETKRTKLLFELQNNTWVKDSKTTLAEFIRMWFDTHKSTLTPYTQAGYKTNIESHIIPGIGHIQLQNLKAITIDQWYKQKLVSGRMDKKDPGGALSPKTILYFHRVLSEALDYAVKMELIVKNPCKYVTPPKQQKKKIEVYGENLLVELLKYIQGHEMELGINIAIATGMRRGEVLGLTWDNVDIDNNLIKVRQELIYTKSTGLKLQPPKSFEGIREIYIPTELTKLIKLTKYQHRQFKNEYALPSDKEFEKWNLVVCRLSGEPITPGAWTKAFKRLIDKFCIDTNISDTTTFHQLRHSWATFQLKYGSAVKLISDVAGHSTTKMTENYQHPDAEMKIDMANKVKKHIYDRLN